MRWSMQWVQSTMVLDDRPFVSVVMPAFNAIEFLKAAVASVQSQTLSNWELVVVNDGSTDGTTAWLDSVEDPRVRVVHHENRGASSARNAALDIARGEFVTFLDADDALPPTSLERRVARFREGPHVDIVDGAVRVCDGQMGDTLRHRCPAADGDFLPRLLHLDEGVFFGVIFMVRRADIGSLRFRTDMTHCEDIMFFAELADRPSFKYGAVKDDVYLYRKTDSSAMSQIERLETGYFQLIERCAELRHAAASDLQALRKRVRRIMFRTWLRRGRPVRALRCAWRLR